MDVPREWNLWNDTAKLNRLIQYLIIHFSNKQEHARILSPHHLLWSGSTLGKDPQAPEFDLQVSLAADKRFEELDLLQDTYSKGSVK